MVNLNCNIFNPIKNQLTKNENTSMYESLIVNFKYLTTAAKLDITQFLETLNYLLVSVFINLEYEFPFVFSYYGRKLFKTNYNWIARSIDEVTDFKISHSSKTSLSSFNKHKEILSKDELALKIILDLQQKALCEFNTINIWKECDLSKMKIDTCKRLKKKKEELGNSSTENSSIKSMVFNFRFLDVRSVEAMLLSED